MSANLDSAPPTEERDQGVNVDGEPCYMIDGEPVEERRQRLMIQDAVQFARRTGWRKGFTIGIIIGAAITLLIAQMG